MHPLILPVLSVIKAAISKKNFTKSPTTAVSALVLGASVQQELIRFQTVEEILLSGVIFIVSARLFFFRDYKAA